MSDMTMERFIFQKDWAMAALRSSDKLVLNVGCNNDPGKLKELDSSRVINCDLFDTDQVLGHSNVVDQLFDVARDSWPFEDDSCALTIFGDILEHLSPFEISEALSEAHRVSEAVCITVPMDDRHTTSTEVADTYPRGAVHRTIVTAKLLESLLQEAGFTVSEWREVEYGSGPHWGKTVNGFFVYAHRDHSMTIDIGVSELGDSEEHDGDSGEALTEV